KLAHARIAAARFDGRAGGGFAGVFDDVEVMAVSLTSGLRLQLHHERCMLRRFDSFLQLLKHRRHVAARHCSGVQPETWESLATIGACGTRLQALNLTLALHEPVNGMILHAPHNVFAHTVPSVDAKLLIQFDAHTACSYLCRQLRPPHDVIISVYPDLTA